MLTLVDENNIPLRSVDLDPKDPCVDFLCICSSLFLSFAGTGKCHLNNLACNSTKRRRCKSFRGKIKSH